MTLTTVTRGNRTRVYLTFRLSRRTSFRVRLW
jgi:hypothetical protein